jgi:hypothetical protein
MTSETRWSRREFLAYGSAFGWVPFLQPRHISLAGARFRITRNGRSKRRYVLIHGDESTAREVLASHIRWNQGIAYAIESKVRTVPIESGRIDPNRMFSTAGAEASLKHLNPDWGPPQVQAALALLDRHREKLIRALLPPPGGLTIALHNNSGDYSVASEKPISDAASLREPANPHAFYLCTDPADYKILAASGYNVLLQAAKGTIKSERRRPIPGRLTVDDGSLSRVAAARNVRYVNLEVGLGHASRQKEMLDWLEWVLP